MFDFSTKTTVESTKFDGVSYVLAKPNNKLRDEVGLATAELRSRVVILLKEAHAIGEKGDSVSELDNIRLAEIIDEQTRIGKQIEKINFTKRVLAINGARVDGREISVAEFFDLADDEAMEEAYSLIKSSMGLTDEETKNSQPLTTSGAVVEAKTSDSTVPVASETAAT